MIKPVEMEHRLDPAPEIQQQEVIEGQTFEGWFNDWIYGNNNQLRTQLS